MIVKTVKKPGDLLVCTDGELEQYREQSSKFTLENILFCISLLQTCMANIKRGVNRRTEMEMTFIRLSTPELSSDNEGLLRRVADIEATLKSGSITVNTVNKQAPAPEKAEESSAPAEPAYEAQKPEQETEPQMPSAEEESIPWAEVLSELTQLNMPLWGVLNGSSAVIQGDFVLIKSDNPTLSAFIRTGTNARDVKTAIKRVTGRAYRLGLYNGAQSQPQAKPEARKDPLENLISKAKDMGINVDVNN